MGSNSRPPRRAAVGGAPREITRDELIADNARLKEHLRSLRASNRASNLASFGRTAVRWTAAAVCIVWSLHEIAGKDTIFWASLDAKIESSSLKELVEAISPKLWVLIVSTLGTAASATGTLRYRRLNKSYIKKLGKLTKDFELLSDPDRSTSGLTEDGETGAQDRT